MTFEPGKRGQKREPGVPVDLIGTRTAHGRLQAYNRYKCRCFECLECRRSYDREIYELRELRKRREKRS